MPAHPGGDPQNEDQGDQGAGDHPADATPSVTASTFFLTTGHPSGELADADHPHRAGPAPRGQPPVDVAA